MVGPTSLRASILVLAALLTAASLPAEAQEIEGPLSAAGRLRIGIDPVLWTADERFGRRIEAGSVVEAVEPLGFDLESESLGTSVMPSLSDVESALEAVTDEPGFRLRLGRSRARVRQTVIRVPFRVDLGLTDWLTVGATVPAVQRRGDVTFLLHADSTTANVGLSPSVDDPGAVSDFLGTLSDAVAAMESRVDELCTVDPEASECVDARDALEEGRAYATSLEAAYGGPLFPFEAAPAAEVLRNRLDTLRTRFEGHGVASVPDAGSLPLAAEGLSGEDFQRLLTDPSLGIGAAPLGSWRSGWELGDVELHGSLRLLEGERTDTAGFPGELRYLVGLTGLVRLGTGTPDHADHFVDVGGGDGQTDVEIRLFGDLGLAAGPGLWADVRYGRQLEGRRIRRIAPPEAVFAPLVTRRTLEWDPGDYVEVEVAPRWRLTPEIAVAGRYRFRSEGADRYRLASDDGDLSLPFPPSVLERETGETLHQAGVSVTYSTLRARAAGRADRPVELRLAYRRAVAGSGGRTPKASRVEAGMRLFWRLWGE